MVLKIPPAALALSAVVGFALPSRATLTVYTTQASYLAALAPTIYTETFNGLVVQPPQPINFSGNGFSYQATTGGGGFFNAGAASPGDVWLSINTATEGINFGSFSGNVSAAGGYFFTSNTSGSFAVGGNYTLTAIDGNDTETQNFTSAFITDFFGVVSDNALVSLSISTAGTGNPDPPFFWPTVDDFIVGSAVPVPEMPTLGAITLGVVGTLIGIARRRR